MGEFYHMIVLICRRSYTEYMKNLYWIYAKDLKVSGSATSYTAVLLSSFIQNSRILQTTLPRPS